MAKRFLYALIDPRDERAYYLGTGLKPEVCLRRHMRQAMVSYGRDLTARDRWLMSVADAGLRPTIKILLTFEDKERSPRDVEREWCEKMLKYDIPLTNVIDEPSVKPIAVSVPEATRKTRPSRDRNATRRTQSPPSGSLMDAVKVYIAAHPGVSARECSRALFEQGFGSRGRLMRLSDAYVRNVISQIYRERSSKQQMAKEAA